MLRFYFLKAVITKEQTMQFSLNCRMSLHTEGKFWSIMVQVNMF